MARDMATPCFAAWSKMRCMRASGLKGLPFSMPSVARRPSCSLSNSSVGSYWMIASSISKAEPSSGGRVLAPMPEVLVGCVFPWPRGQGVDLEALLEPVHGLITVADLAKAPHHGPDPVTRQRTRQVAVGSLPL